ncbi:hypothetical protein [Bacillus pretiosus]|uniref:hypothetical protein n=1 Tax=Bacillus pretiosus TaxID=2983392 RepID=UPI003D65335B
MKLETTIVITYDPTDNIETTAFMAAKEMALKEGMELVGTNKPLFSGNNLEVHFKQMGDFFNEHN